MSHHVEVCSHGVIHWSCRCCPGPRPRIVACDPDLCDDELARIEALVAEYDREHDPQPAPVPNDEPHSVDIAIEFLRERKEFGIAKYGTALQPHNGRDSLSDAIDEAADLLVYLINARAERDS